jgi:hypothetical protein
MLNKKEYIFECSDGIKYSIPVEIIAQSMARYYAEVDQISYEESYNNVVSLFNESDFEIEDWARNNMDWSDVKEFSTIVSFDKKRIKMQEEWLNPQNIEIVRR